MKENFEIMDGNTACAKISYLFSEAAVIYPITPASTMAELVDVYTNNGMVNLFGDMVDVTQMQSEAGAIGAVHGMLQNGVLATTYTASQGLLLMIPNMYKIAGELLPMVINVAARTIATHALSIMGDHSDIYSVLKTGYAIFCSSSPQQVYDLTSVPYLSSMKSKIPFVNFFDGFRTSHEYNVVKTFDTNMLKELLPISDIDSFRKRSLDTSNPTTRGTNEGDQIYFQSVEARNKYYDDLPDIVNSYIEKINNITDNSYKLFNYYGNSNAENIVVAMGSVCGSLRELIIQNPNYGFIEVHLFRPFSEKYFLSVLPRTVKNIAVLDRSKDSTSKGVLYLDVVNIVNSNKLNINVISGIYGLSGKNTNLNDLESIYLHLEEGSNKDFTIGINDDVTFRSLEPTNTIFKTNSNEILIYGYGSDGMVTTAKDILKIMFSNTNKYIQGYFEYDSKKSGGVTKCHLRFSDSVITGTYYNNNNSIIICTKDTYLKKYNILDTITNNGIFILNTEYNKDNIEKILPIEVIKIMQDKNIKFYIVNASKIARNNNIPNKISMIMEMVILNKLNIDNATLFVSELIKKNFSKKGEDVVNNNLNAIKEALDTLEEIDVTNIKSVLGMEKIDNTLFSYLDHGMGNLLPVSSFMDINDGVFVGGMSKFEKRSVSDVVPHYDKSKCISCNLCSLVCPHAVIRGYLLNKDEVDNAPECVKKDLIDSKIKDCDYKFTIGVSIKDCTGCSLCTKVCPTKAIEMKSIYEDYQNNIEKYNYLETITEKDVLPISTIKGLGFKKPKFEFSGACSGCGEATYIKILSQLFGENLIIANATGCSSIYGASVPNTPYTVPWANSLFEDNAEFGYGIKLAEDVMKNKIRNIMKKNVDKLNPKNRELVDKYLNDYSKETSLFVKSNIDYNDFKDLEPLKKYMDEKSIWIIGGDGWAYDIGFGGIDHVLANNKNVKILVLDTEVYSNTGGQSSKSTNIGAVAKFASSGKKSYKKDLAKIAMTYPHVYVATISLGASYQGTIRTLIEANQYEGPAIVIAYAPCIAHGIKEGMSSSLFEEKLVVDSGYFPLFRYNPSSKEFSLDSKADFSKYDEVFKRELRYNTLDKKIKDMQVLNKQYAQKKYESLEKLVNRNNGGNNG